MSESPFVACDSVEMDFAKYVNYLTGLTRMYLNSQLRAKVDASGVVQQTLLEAHRAYASVAGRTERQRLAWLRRILVNNLTDAVRRITGKTRNVFREQSLPTGLHTAKDMLSVVEQ